MASTHGAEWSGRFVQVSEIEGVLLIAGDDMRTHQPPAGWVLTDPDNPVYLPDEDVEIYALAPTPDRFHLAA